MGGAGRGPYNLLGREGGLHFHGEVFEDAGDVAVEVVLGVGVLHRDHLGKVNNGDLPRPAHLAHGTHVFFEGGGLPRKLNIKEMVET